MTSANIDELKIIIEAEDKATGTIQSLIDKLDGLSNVSVGGKNFNDFSKNIKDTNSVLKKTEEELKDIEKELKKADDIAGFTKTISRADTLRFRLRDVYADLAKLANADKFDKKAFHNALDRAKSLEERIEKIDQKEQKLAQKEAEKSGGVGFDAVGREAEEANSAVSDLHKTAQLTTEQFLKLSQIDLTAMKVFSAKQKVDALREKGADKGQIARAVEGYKKMTAEYEKMFEARKRLEETPAIGKGEEASIEGAIRGVEQSASQTATAMDGVVKKGEEATLVYDRFGRVLNRNGQASFEAPKSGGEYTGKELEKIAWNAEKANHKVKGLGKTAEKAFKQMGKLANKAGKEISKIAVRTALFPMRPLINGVKGLSKGMDALFKKFKTVLTYRALRGFIKLVNEGFKEGTNNVYQWSKALGDSGKTVNGRLTTFAGTMDRLSTSALYLRNSFGAMATPLLNAVAPAIDIVVDKIVTILNAINMLVARLTNASSWTRALRYPKEYAEAIDGATGSAGKLKDALVTILGIDEINPLNSQNDNAGGGGGGGADALDYSSMFEEVSFEAEKTFNDFFKPLEDAWATKGKGVIDSIHNAMDGVRTLSDSVKTSFWEVWTNGTGQTAVEHILGIFTGISNTIGNISRQLSVGWEFDGNGTRLVQALADTLNDILAMWDEIANKTAEWASELDFSGLIDGFADLAEGIEKVVEPLTRAVVWTWENVILELGKWAIERGLPKALESLGTNLGKIGDALTTIGNSKAGEVLGGILSVLKDNAITSLDRTVQRFTDLFNIIGAIADVISGKKSIKVALFEIMEEKANRLNTILHYLSEAVEALVNLDFKGVENAVRNALNPTNSEYYLNLTARVNKIDDKRTQAQRRLEFLAEITKVDEDMPTGSTGFGTVGGAVSGVRYAWGGGGLPNLGKINFNGEAEVDVVANATTLEDNLRKRDVRTIANLTDKKELFDKTTGKMTANLYNKSEGFSKTTSAMTAWLSGKSETFAKTTGAMTATLSKKAESFGFTTGAMTANLSKKTEGFGKTTGSMTAYLPYKSEQFGTTTKPMTAYINDFYKAPGAKLTLTGTAIGNGRMQFMKSGGIYENGFWKNIPQYAHGTLDAGSMFIAGESGAELVGHINNRTEVLNQSQIAQAMASSMMQANAQQNAILQEQNSLLRQMLAKDSTVTAILSTSSLTDGVARKNRREGKTVIPIGV